MFYDNRRNRLEQEKDSINSCFHESLVTKGSQPRVVKAWADKHAVLLSVASQINGGTSPAKIEVGESPVSLDR